MNDVHCRAGQQGAELIIDGSSLAHPKKGSVTNSSGLQSMISKGTLKQKK